MNSGADVAANLELAESLLAEAAADGVEFAVLPENFAIMGKRGRDKVAHAEAAGEGPIQTFLASMSLRHRMWIVAGSMPLASPEEKSIAFMGRARFTTQTVNRSPVTARSTCSMSYCRTWVSRTWSRDQCTRATTWSA